MNSDGTRPFPRPDPPRRATLTAALALTALPAGTAPATAEAAPAHPGRDPSWCAGRGVDDGALIRYEADTAGS
ncbi:hypothetical protein ABZY20_33015 [Streptomyces sp. NPDC006624]|uniref:hypothetical protein n=1 Tax=Streptomyces sp. NPDC006624 TaxID=3154892 RepID=UPI0033AFA317